MKRQKQFATRMYGETILERLKELGMSKADLIRSANISPSTLNRAIEGEISAYAYHRSHCSCA